MKIIRKLPAIILLFISLSQVLFAQTRPAWANETDAQKEERMKWWHNDHFGMFIHWGLYSMPARHEWVRNHEKISNEEYEKYFNNFEPDLYNPKEWARKAKEAGMKYFVITTKHHEGFCLWDSKYTDYKVTNTPIKRDLLKEMVDAFRAEGLKVGFYYSLIDWHHPDFPVDHIHPMRDNAEARAANSKKDIKKYQQYLKNQVTELLTQFGEIDELWLDFSYPGKDGKGHEDWDSENLLKIIRKLQPGIIVNDRLDLGDTDWGWDFKSPEQFMPKEWVSEKGKKVNWETCQTFSGSWGYHRDETSWKSVPQLISMLIETVSKGGNLLLNVGPTSRGLFDVRADERLKGIGEWMKYNSRAIYGCTAAPAGFKKPDNSLLTYNADRKRLYVHVLEWPIDVLSLDGYKGKVKYAQILNDGSEVKFKEEGENLVLRLPVKKPDTEVPVIELILE